ncbi:MAG: hypothetical protein HYX69_10625 [Planctomycetia bacterium]|nr:hypothetical protein [Planctomycetia bacterium]
MPTTETKPRRRWFQFGLATMLLMVAICACLMTWIHLNLDLVREREAALARPAAVKVHCSDSVANRLPLAWQWIGTTPRKYIKLDRRLIGEEDVARLRALYPEATIEVIEVRSATLGHDATGIANP